MCSLHSNSTILNSKVVSVIVKPNPNLASTPVEIEFPHLHNVSPPLNPSVTVKMEENGGVRRETPSCVSPLAVCSPQKRAPVTFCLTFAATR